MDGILISIHFSYSLAREQQATTTEVRLLVSVAAYLGNISNELHENVHGHVGRPSRHTLASDNL